MTEEMGYDKPITKVFNPSISPSGFSGTPCAQFVARICFLSLLTFKQNSAANTLNTVKLATWKAKPPTMISVPAFEVALSFAVSAKAPPADCSTRARMSEAMKVMV